MSLKRWVIFLFLLVALPLAGALLSGMPIGSGRIFSPYSIVISTRDSMPSQPFSFVYSLFLLCVGLAAVLFFLVPIARCSGTGRSHVKPFPWWGWTAFASLGALWAVAWKRPFEPILVRHLTFTLLWCSYIVLVNALTFARSGKSLLTHRTGYLCKLFLCSVPFWWYFEYLNRYVLNWYYLFEPSFRPSYYLVFGSFAFATVLPAVLSTRDLLLTFPAIQDGFDHLFRLRLPEGKGWGVLLFAISCIGMAGIGAAPLWCYPLVCIAPLLLLVSLQILWKKEHVFTPPREGRYSIIAASALAALVCGFVWEVWNIYSMPKWVYAVPWIWQIRLFEMPLIGYFGYLPFGLQCEAVGELFDRG